ncbi:MAG: sigma factor-like helix-turn-helix DNA-binding protein [Metamycoplasmataceae bacterium]
MEELKKRNQYINALDKFSFVLTQNQLQIMSLYLIEDLSLQEIANILATSRSAVFDSIKKSKKKLDPFLDKLN